MLNIQTSALRFLLGVGKTCPMAGLFGETGWVPFTMSIRFSILKFRKRLAGLENDHLTKIVYGWSKSLAGPNCKNWMWKTKTLLESIQDFGGLLSVDEIWNELAKLELKVWKDTIQTIPSDSDTGGRFIFTEKLNSFHSLSSMYNPSCH